MAPGGVPCAVLSLRQGRGEGRKAGQARGVGAGTNAQEEVQATGDAWKPDRPVLLEIKLDGRCRDESEDSGQHRAKVLSP